MLDSRFYIAIHILTFLAIGEKSSSQFIAKSLNINPVLVRNMLSILRNHGFIFTKEGKNGGSYLAKASSDIALSEVFKACYQETPLFSFAKNEPNQNCPLGKEIEKLMNKVNNQAAIGLCTQLESISIKDLSSGISLS